MWSLSSVSAAVKLAGWLRRLAGRPLSPTEVLVRDAQAEGRRLLRAARLAEPTNEREVRELEDRVVRWYGSFELTLGEADAALFERFRSPGLPEPVTLDALRRTIRSDLKKLRQIKRHLSPAWPVWALKVGRAARSWIAKRRRGDENDRRAGW